MGVLETEGLRRSFGALTAVDGVSIDVEANETRGIIGPNGAGKSTFFNCISGTLPPDEGEVRLNGDTVTGLPPHRIAQRGLARSFQTPQLFESQSVSENVYLAQLAHETSNFRFDVFRTRRDVDSTAIDQVLETVGLENHLDTRAADLSHGDKRRLEIAMTIVSDSAVVLLDEPMAGLTIADIEEVTDMLRSVTEDNTLLIIEHNIGIVMDLCDKITVLHNGRELLTGTPSEVRNNDRVSEVYFGGDR